LNLLRPFVQILLIYAYGIYPQDTLLIRKPKTEKRPMKVICDDQGFLRAMDNLEVSRVSPNV
jgi:hypothetical protein